MIFKFRYLVQGGHTHVRLFAGPHQGALGKCGDLAFRNEEWDRFRAALENHDGPIDTDFEFQNEEDDHSTLIPR